MFADLEAEILQFRNDRDWKQFHTPRNLAASITIEAAELLELFQWAKDEELDQVVEEQRGRIREELADLFIYITLMSHDLGIDLEEAVTDKLEFNGRKYPVERAKGSSRKYTELDARE